MFKRLITGVAFITIAIFVTENGLTQNYYTNFPLDSLKINVAPFSDEYPMPFGPAASGVFTDWTSGNTTWIDTSGHPTFRPALRDTFGVVHSIKNYMTSGGWVYTGPDSSDTYKPSVSDTGAVDLYPLSLTTDTASFQLDSECMFVHDSARSTIDFIVNISWEDTVMRWKMGLFEEEMGTDPASVYEGIYFYYSGDTSGPASYNTREIQLVASKDGARDSVTIWSNDSSGSVEGTSYNQNEFNVFRFRRDITGAVSAYINGEYAGRLAASIYTTPKKRMTVGLTYKLFITRPAARVGGYLRYIGATQIRSREANNLGEPTPTDRSNTTPGP